MTLVKWDKVETFTTAAGTTAIQYAVRESEGVTEEFSLHDPTIQKLLPSSFWLPVYSYPLNNFRFDIVGGWWVALFGFGKPEDPMGKLMLARVKTQPGYSPERVASFAARIAMQCEMMGLGKGTNTTDSFRKS
jgi:hypothetical protein